MAEPEETFILHGANHCWIKGGSTMSYCRRKWCRLLECFAAIQSVPPILSQREQGSHHRRTSPILLHRPPVTGLTLKRPA